MFRLFLLLFGVLFSSELTDIKSLRADFKQITFQQGREVVYMGHIVAKKDRGSTFAKWSYTAPLQKEVYINKSGVIIYEPRLFQVTYAKRSLDILGILSSAKLESAKGERKIYELRNSGVDYAILTIKGVVDSIRFRDELENLIEIKLSNVKLDSKVDDTIFDFTPPDGVDVIKQD